MKYLTYVIAALAIIGTAANSFQKRWCFYIWLVTNAFWCIYDFKIGAYAQAVQFVVYFMLSVNGLMQWRGGGK